MSLPRIIRHRLPVIGDENDVFRRDISRAILNIDKRLSRIEALLLLRTYEPEFEGEKEGSPPEGYDEKVAFALEDGIIFVQASEIVRCQADSNYTWIHLRNGKSFLQSHTLRDVEKQLPKTLFLRVHKSHLVNRTCIDRYVTRRGSYLIMEDQSKIPLARQRKDYFFRAMKIRPVHSE